MTTYTFPKTQVCGGHVVKVAGPAVRGLIVCERPGLPAARRDRWQITHARSGSWLLLNLHRTTAIAVAKKMAELANWDLPASRLKKQERHARIVHLARVNPREFAKNGGGMEKR